MASKELYTALEELFAENEKSHVTYENVMELFTKPPTPANVKKLMGLLEKYKVSLISSAEIAKLRNKEEAKKREEERQKLQDEALEDEFDLASEKELLEWSRSDSPVRMYLREMGQISLLTKDEEIDISKKIEFGEDIIIDAFCSVPYLIDFILDYKEALINRERRVKELFKTFEDDDDSDDSDDDTDEEYDEDGEEKKTFSKKDNTRTEKVIESFKALEKAKKDWLKSFSRPPEEDLNDPEEMMNYDLSLAYKKKLAQRSIDGLRTNQ